jgi:hypothetical protein
MRDHDMPEGNLILSAAAEMLKLAEGEGHGALFQSASAIGMAQFPGYRMGQSAALSWAWPRRFDMCQ